MRHLTVSSVAAAALGLVGAIGPWALGDSLPLQHTVTAGLACLAVGVAVALLGRWPWVAVLTALLFLGLLQGWVRVGGDAEALRHLVRLAVGICVMAVTARFLPAGRLPWLMAAYLLAGVLVVLVSVPALELYPHGAKYLPAALNAWLGSTSVTLPFVPGGRVNPNALGATILMFLPVALAVMMSGRWRPGPALRGLAVTFVLVGGAGLVVTQSRTSLGSAAVVLGLFFLAKTAAAYHLTRRQVVGWVAAMGIALVAALAAMSNAGESAARQSDLGVRADVWRQGWNLMLDHPWTGIGPGRFGDHYVPSVKVARDFRIAHSHNTLLQVALDAGVPGALAYLALHILLLVTAFRTVTRADGPQWSAAVGMGLALVGTSLFGLMDAIALGATVSVFLWFACGCILISGDTARPEAGIGE